MLSPPHPSLQVVHDSLLLHRIACALRQRRFDGGALRLDNTRLFFKLDEQGNPCDYGVYEQVGVDSVGSSFACELAWVTYIAGKQCIACVVLIACLAPPCCTLISPPLPGGWCVMLVQMAACVCVFAGCSCC
jgi:hypothetical protein